MRKEVVVTRWSPTSTHRQTLPGDKKQQAGQYQTHSLASCHLKFSRLAPDAKQPIGHDSILNKTWLSFLKSDALHGVCSPVPINKNVYFFLKENCFVKLCVW